MPSTATRWYGRWILANGWAEAAGLGTTLLVGSLAGPVLETRPSVKAVLAGALLAIVLGVLLEGVLVGAAQERVLRLRLPLIPRRAWTLATAGGAGLAWILGMVPSTVMALGESSVDVATPESSALAQYALAATLGATTGPILGVVQWTVLRRYVRGAGHWLWANALAWAVGMPLIFAGMDQVPWAGPAALRVACIYSVCWVTGTAVGAIHGWILVRLVPFAPSPASSGLATS